jgi:hypothetical protein
MGRNKYGLPIPEPRDPPVARHKHHKHEYAEGGKIMGFFDRETDAEKSKRYIKEAEARAAAREAAARAAEQAQPASAPRAADVLASDPNSVAGRIKKRRDMANDATNEEVPAKRKGGIIKAKSKPRGVGCAVKGHGKGRMR